MKHDRALERARLERERVEGLLALVKPGGTLALDLGARDGHISARLAPRFAGVVALDLVAPGAGAPNVHAVVADGTRLPFGDAVFDTVLCAEVLEHVAPDSKLRALCSEIARVAAHEVVIGVPYRQDLRVARTTCMHCGARNPPWGHVNRFDEARLFGLFDTLTPSTVQFVGRSREVTNPLSASLLDFAGNPWGTYGQSERCIACGNTLGAPRPRDLLQRAASKAAHLLTAAQRLATPARGNWIHVRFEKALPPERRMAVGGDGRHNALRSTPATDASPGGPTPTP